MINLSFKLLLESPRHLSKGSLTHSFINQTFPSVVAMRHKIRKIFHLAWSTVCSQCGKQDTAIEVF